MAQAALFDRSRACLIENYGRLPLVMVKGEGSLIWDADGNRYIDLFSGFGAGGVSGHCHPRVVEAVSRQASELLSHGNLFSNVPQIELAERITKTAFGGKVFFCHSGAEADEAAIKLVRLAAGPGRYKIISFDDSFHGRTMGGLSLSPASFQDGFEPMLPGNIRLPLGNLEAVRSAVDSQTAGIFIEPIQGEGGLNVVPTEFLQGLRDICDQHKLLLVFDEVWSAPARTGEWYAYQHTGVVPDVMTLAKALGGGLPLAACVAAGRWSEVLGQGTHGCTLGGNPLCAAAGLAAMKLIEEEQLVERARRLEGIIKQRFNGGSIPLAGDVRGRGCMLGVRLDESVQARDIMNRCREQGVLVCLAKQNVIRLAPALTIPEEQLSEGLDVLLDVLESA